MVCIEDNTAPPQLPIFEIEKKKYSIIIAVGWNIDRFECIYSIEELQNILTENFEISFIMLQFGPFIFLFWFDLI